uniref:Secreted RxLR effector protein 70 n=1 Tax=Plasmopara viticola TaxID=143451 RepID=RLR70_PLAVT|nr:RecName: Full=Secreted RxLR effector protein 70; Flags: Precursor [Plasmopara viticola]
MRGAYYIITALLVVASSQELRGSGHQLQIYDHDVVKAVKAVMKTLPNRFLRESRDVHDDLANEERSFYSILADIINKGMDTMPRAAEGVELMPNAAEGVEKMPRAAEGVETIPHAAEGVENMPHVPDEGLSKALTGAKTALNKLWGPFSATTPIGDASHDVSSREQIDFEIGSWSIDLRGFKPIAVHDQHKDMIQRVYTKFGQLCGNNLNPTAEETSLIWTMFDSRIVPSSSKDDRLKLIWQARQNVRSDMRSISSSKKWRYRWQGSPDSLTLDVLNSLLNMHYQRWVRMYDIFKQERPDLIDAPSNSKHTLGGNKDSSSATTLHKHSKGLSSRPFEPLNAVMMSHGDRFVSTQRSKRTFGSNADTVSLPLKQPKMRSSKALMPLSATLGDYSVPPLKSRLNFGGASSAFVPYTHPKAHTSKSLAPASTTLTLKDSELELSLGGIYDKNTG